MTMKSVDLPHLRSVVLAGHAGAGKTTLAEQLLFKAGAIPRLGSVDDGTAHLDFEPEEQKRRESLSLAVATFEYDGTRITLVDTPGLPGLRGRGRRGLRRRRRRALRHGRLGGRRGRPRARPSRWAARPARRPASSSTSATGRTPTRRPRSTPCARRSATRSRRSSSRSAPAESFERLRRPRPSQGVASGTARRRSRSRSRTTSPTRSRAPRPAARGRRRGRRRRPDQVPRGRGDLRRGARGLPPQGRQGIDPGAGARRLGGEGHRHARRCSTRSSATSPPRPTRHRSRPADKAGAEVEIPPDQTGPLARRASSRPPPTRSSGGSRTSASCPARSTRRRHVWNADARRGRAHRPAAAAPRQGPGADRRAQGRRDRRGREADRDRDRRHAVDQGEAAAACRRSTSRSRR